MTVCLGLLGKVPVYTCCLITLSSFSLQTDFSQLVMIWLFYGNSSVPYLVVNPLSRLKLSRGPRLLLFALGSRDQPGTWHMNE